MSLGRWLVVLALAGGAWHWWSNQGEVNLEQTVAEQGTPAGFVPVFMPSDFESDRVYILTPPNCPSDKAQKARDLAGELARHDIPHATRSGYSGQVNNPTDEKVAAMRRGLAVMEEGPPAVFINGYAKSDPSFSEVRETYASTR